MRHGILVIGTALLLGALSAGPALAQETESPAPDGAALYHSNCSGCHDDTGAPTAMGKMLKAPDLSAPERADVPVDSIMAVISAGKGKMKGFADRLSEAEIKALAEYVKTLVKEPEKER